LPPQRHAGTGLSPLRGLVLNPSSDAAPEAKRLAKLLAELATAKKTTPLAVALAWLLCQPAGIVPILGSSNPEHLVADCAADNVTLTRSEWYALFSAAAAMEK
jgi:predicted oxidoreductase